MAQHIFIVTVETLDDTVMVELIRDEISSNLESLDSDVGITSVRVREYIGRPWLLLGGVQE